MNEASFQAHPDVNVCNVNWKSYVLIGDYSSSAQFYVTFAVFVFLYCIAALLLYVGYTSLYRDNRKLPMIVSKYFIFIQKSFVQVYLIFGVKYRFSYTGNQNSWHKPGKHILIWVCVRGLIWGWAFSGCHIEPNYLSQFATLSLYSREYRSLFVSKSYFNLERSQTYRAY